MVYNLMTCEGGNWVRTEFLGDCTMSWFSFAIILIIAMVARRQAEDGFLSGISFNAIGAFIGGLGLNLLVITLLGSARWALVAGIVGIALGGYIFGLILGGSEA